jgi:ribosome maturation factor RimP
MNESDIISKIKTIASEVAVREGCVLYDAEMSGAGRNRVVRILVDDASGNVSVEQCANVSRGVSLLLDVQETVPGGAYELEVGSPGIERQLKELWHYEKAIGKEVKLALFEPVALGKGQTHVVQGQLISLNDSKNVTVKTEHHSWDVELSNIKKANVVFELVQKNKKR